MRGIWGRALTLCAGASLALLCGNAEAISARIAYNASNFSVFGDVPQIQSGESHTAANGQEVPASILYTDEAGGTSNFLAVSEVAELLDADVRWDGGSSTVDFGTADTPWPDTVNAPFTELVWESGAEPAEAADVLLGGMRVQSASSPFCQSFLCRPGQGAYILLQVENLGEAPVSFTVFRERTVGPDRWFPTDTVLPGETLCRVFAVAEEGNDLTANLRMEVRPLPDAKLEAQGLVPMDIVVNAFQENSLGDGLEARTMDLPVVDSYQGLSMEVTDQTEDSVTVEVWNRGERIFTGGREDTFTLERFRNGVWEEVPQREGNFATLPVQQNFPAGTSTEMTFFWQGRYGTLPEGTYRVAKSFGEYGARQDCCCLTAEFTV